jgi:hypothetical protein
MAFFYSTPPLTPTMSSGGWDADDEASDSEGSPSPNPFDFVHLSTSLAPVAEPQAIFNYTICRDSNRTLWTIGKSDGWTNTSYLLWEMCATLADVGVDVEWTRRFEQWRPEWNRIQDHVKSYGETHFSSEIPLAPIGFALVTLHDRSFEIDQDGGEDQLDVWALWRYVIELPAGEMGTFEVVLMDTV